MLTRASSSIFAHFINKSQGRAVLRVSDGWVYYGLHNGKRGLQLAVGSSTSSVVEINGNQYDAYSGQLIKAGKKTTQQVKYHTAKVIDGFVKSKSAGQSQVTKSEKKPKVINKKDGVQSSVITRHIVHSARSLHRHAEKSHTLMRHAVAKPVELAKKSLAESMGASGRSKLANQRVKHAKTVVKHAKVRRFAPEVPKAESHHASHSIARTEIVARPSGASVAAAVVPTALSNQRLEAMLDQALIRAGRMPRPNLWQKIRRAPRWLTITTLAAIIALLSLFFIWQSIPQVAIRVASIRAHMAASMPSYTPTGFSFWKPVIYQDGTVTVRFRADANHARSYDLSQQKSTWNSATLASSLGTDQLQTTEINGTTVYIYGAGSDAAWVNRGMLFKISDRANLTSDQIVRIAQSL